MCVILALWTQLCRKRSIMSETQSQLTETDCIPFRMQDDGPVAAATKGRRALTTSTVGGAAALSRRELRGTSAMAEGGAAAASRRRLLQTPPLSAAAVEAIM